MEILAKSTNVIKVKVLSDGWFRVGSIRILTNDTWFSVGRMGAVDEVSDGYTE